MSDYTKYRRESFQRESYEPEGLEDAVLLISTGKLREYLAGKISMEELAQYCGKLQMSKPTLETQIRIGNIKRAYEATKKRVTHLG